MKRLCLVFVLELVLAVAILSVLPVGTHAQTATFCQGFLGQQNVSAYASSGDAVKLDQNQPVDL